MIRDNIDSLIKFGKFQSSEGILKFKNKEYVREVEFLNIGKNEIIDLSILPSSVESIISLENVNYIMSSQDNYNIKSISIPYYFNYKLFSIFKRIQSLETLTFSSNLYCRERPIEFPIDSFPNTLTELNLNLYYYQIKKDVLPNSLKKLSIFHSKELVKGQSRVQLFEYGSIPKGLQYLTIKSSQPFILGDKLPNGLLSFNFKQFGVLTDQIKSSYCDDYSFSVSLDDNNIGFQFPKSLTSLSITINSNSIFGNLPNDLKELNLSLILPSDKDKYNSFILEFVEKVKYLSNLKNLEYLSLKSTHEDNSSLLIEYPLPDSLKSLSIYLRSIVNSSNNPILPIYSNHLEKLEIKYNYPVYIKSNLNGNEKTLINLGFNQKLLPNQLPSSIKYLSFNDTYGQFNNGGEPLSKINTFPLGLVYLNLGDQFNVIIDQDVLPNTLKTLIIGTNFNQQLLEYSIPLSLEYLEIKNRNYNHSINLSQANENLVLKLYNLNLYCNHHVKLINPKLKSVFFPTYSNSTLDSLGISDENKLLIEYLEFDSYACYNSINFNCKRFPFGESNLGCDNIKTLIVGNGFNNLIDLKYFKNLVTIIIKGNDSNPQINLLNNIDGNNIYGNLKSIQVSIDNISFLDNLHSNPFLNNLIKLIK